ncbi:S-phase kinase-associated protein 1 [Trypanosoma rangeli]|uniref:S-phase kinase-associated protein 1 n=1 Tax=Trypanosoma rangeli TaxID=5698 RepID=A0A3R7MAE7_TRYRA|nr:S-phase kinase-associated protein 1 [Trypanosoma rangeli]RNF11921.1 S-phase kinase-associated protein 1 [Trypanosoma rangeli]|eukprot:RNF11921.1 S-phase kinase-associated protein 1 [Trypanosoma rangeli]
MPGQLLVLIGSDGKQATVSRSVATQASLVLRDLLDGREPTRNLEIIAGVTKDQGNEASFGQVVTAENTATTTTTTTTTAGGSGSSSVTNIPAIELPFPYFTSDLLQRICAHMTYRYNYQPPIRDSKKGKRGE